MSTSLKQILVTGGIFFVLNMESHCSEVSAPQRWSVVETARDNGHLLTDLNSTEIAGTARSGTTIVCELNQPCQEMFGFGGALTESAAWALAQLPSEARRDVLRKYFDPKEGIGYTVCRTHINSCDFSLSTWALDETPGDVELKDFTLEPMRKWLLPLIRDVHDIVGSTDFRLLASPWSPPAWMKTNGQMTQGGALRPEYRDAWARYYVRFVRAMEREEHIGVWALTVQNEPEAKQTWESCLYTPEEERDFIRDHLGPTLAKEGLDAVRLLAWDHNRDRLDARAAAIFGDQKASAFVWGAALHWYVSDDFAASSRVHAAYPDKHIFFTEGCLESGAKLGQWDRGERYAHQMIGDFRNWVCGWLDWNIALDIHGGPNHVGNFCDAPVLIDGPNAKVNYQNSFYYIAHFSRYVKPGARRIVSNGGPAALESVAFLNSDKTLVVVVMNPSDSPAEFSIGTDDGTIRCSIPPHAIQTYLRG
ncbi:MAG TPA: glycoside hydrolase family 30 protein [Opitutaceae bacterium]|nr:glycoside hydrolase family 30 protein [Opitutaceae bacterium]